MGMSVCRSVQLYGASSLLLLLHGFWDLAWVVRLACQCFSHHAFAYLDTSLLLSCYSYMRVTTLHTVFVCLRRRNCSLIVRYILPFHCLFYLGAI